MYPKYIGIKPKYHTGKDIRQKLMPTTKHTKDII
jgi:hypothetical protein